MIAFFTTAKPFEDHSGIIQRNALTSWKSLDPEVEVIRVGDESGVAEMASELGLRHEPHVRRNQCGRKRLDSMFARARSMARHEALCYSNCDIIFDRAAPTLARFLHFRLWNPFPFFLLGAPRPVWAALGLRSAATMARSKK
jgi:hypothetical protein